MGPLFAKFKNLSMPIAWGVTLVGLGLTLVAPAFMVLCVAGFVVALGKETYVPLEGNLPPATLLPRDVRLTSPLAWRASTLAWHCLPLCLRP